MQEIVDIPQGAGLVFEPVEHRYRVNGREVPGVSRVLEVLGFNDFEHVAPDVLAAKRQLGSDVHAATVMIDKGTLDWSSIDDAMMPYLQAYMAFRDACSDWKAIVTEEPFYDQGCDTAGMPDRVYRTPLDDVLGDLKCGVVVPKHRLQTAGYCRILNAQKTRRWRAISRRCGIYLRGNGTFKLVWHEDLAGDLRAFAAARQLYEWRAKNVGAYNPGG